MIMLMMLMLMMVMVMVLVSPLYLCAKAETGPEVGRIDEFDPEARSVWTGQEDSWWWSRNETWNVSTIKLVRV